LSSQTLPEPISVSVAEAKRLSGFGITKIYEFINDGRLKSTKIGQRRVVEFASLKALLTGAPDTTTA